MKNNTPTAQPNSGDVLPSDIIDKLLKIRDALVENDVYEAYHWLYSIASPHFDKLEPWAEMESKRAAHPREDAAFKSSYIQEYKQMKEYEKFLGGPAQWTEEKVKGMNRIEVLEALRGYQELIQFLDNTIYCIEEGSAQWEERAKQAERADADGSGKEEAVDPVDFHKWMIKNNWQWHNDGFWFRSKDYHQWPPDEYADTKEQLYNLYKQSK